MKRLFLIPLTIILACGVILGSYAESAEVIKLRFNTQQPEQLWDIQYGAKPWFREVEKATGGKVKFDEFYNQILSKGPDAWQATRAGVADISWVFHGYTPGVTTLADVVTLPFMGFKSPAQSSAILWKLYEEFPKLAGQFKENKILFTWASVPFFLINNKREIKTMEDQKGLKLRVAGGPPTEAAKALGITPILMPMPDTYLSLQKKVMDGMAATWDILGGFKQYEVVKYYTYVPFYTIYFSFAMNWNVWNRLPPDVQKVFTDLGGLKGSIFYGTHFFEGYEQRVGMINSRMVQMIKGKGYEMNEYTIPPGELEKWKEVAGKPLWKKWVADRVAEGHTDAQKILDRTLELIESYNP
jgi:TRAP-type C4-dicarboxylate transport system substrate-binding protein